MAASSATLTSSILNDSLSTRLASSSSSSQKNSVSFPKCTSFVTRISSKKQLSFASSSLVSPLQLNANVETPFVPKFQLSVTNAAAKKKYKLKTHKASAKRFRVTGSGMIVCRHAWRAHLLRKKSVKRKNRLAGLTPIFRGDIDKVVGALPYLKVNRRRLPNAVRIEEEVEEVEEEEEVEA